MGKTKSMKISIGTFDLIKGISMLSIVFGHMIFRYDMGQMALLTPFLVLLTPFETAFLPMFFIISGFSFREKPLAKMLKKTWSEMIIPYLFVTLFVAMLFPVIHYLNFKWWPGAVEETIRTVLAFLFGIPTGGKVIFGYQVYESTVVWFLLALFFALNGLNLVLKVKKESVQAAAAVCCVVLGYLLLRLDFIYFCLPQGLMAAGYCYIGYLMKKYNFFSGGKSLKWAYVAMGAVAVWQLAFGDYNLAHGTFKYGLLDYFASICAGILFMALGIYAGRLEWKGLEWIKQIGVYTYWIMCIHSVEMTCIPWYRLTEYFAEQQIIAFSIEVCVKTVIITSGCLVLKQITKIKYSRRLSGNGK